MKKRFCLLGAAMMALLAIKAQAEILESFEHKEAVKRVKTPHSSQRIDYCSDFFTEGTRAVKYYMPRWRPGVPIWLNLHIELPPGKRNLKNCNYLVLDLINTSPYTEELILFIADEKQRFNKGYCHKTIKLLAETHARIFIKTSDIAKKSDLSRLKTISITRRKPRRDTELVIDAIQALKPGEKPSAISKKAAETLSKLLIRVNASPAPQAKAGLYDFEVPEDLRRFRSVKPGSYERSKKYATSGNYSLHYRSPVHKQGENEWRGLRMFPTFDKKNWTGYDWFVFDVINPTKKLHHTRFFLTDSKIPFRLGYRSEGFNFQPYSHQRVVIPVSRVASKIDIRDIFMLHFIVHKPTGVDYELYFDNFHLLKPNGISKPVNPKVFKDLIALNLKNSGFSQDKTIALCIREMNKFPENTIWGKRSREQLKKIQININKLTRELNNPKLSLKDFFSLKKEIQKFSHKIKRVNSELEFLKKSQELYGGDGNIGTGTAAISEKIPPRNIPFHIQTNPQISLALARGEKEGIQLLVMPYEKTLKDVTIKINNLKDARGNVFSAKDVDLEIVGYLQTQNRPSYDVAYLGWYPHVLLNYFKKVDVKPHTLQAFYLRFKCPRTQQAGLYKGQVQMLAGTRLLQTFPVELRVYRFELPSRPVLPTAMSCGDDMRFLAGRIGANWGKLRVKFVDFMAEYGLEPDGIYRPSGPDWEMMIKLKKEGKISAFNLCSFEQMMKSKNIKDYVQEAVKRIRPHYNKAKELGLLEYAYVYGFDESPSAKFPWLAACANAFKKEFPGLSIMTTSHDTTYGMNSLLKNVDIWCPVINFYDKSQAAKARSAGKKVWWYLSPSAVWPFPNLWVESNGIDMRIMHGFMSAKLKPDGFLYYAINLWGKNKPITEHDSFLKWNPISFASLHGDGCIVYGGPGATPMASFALENMRDGFEDLAYYRLLDKCAQIYRNSHDPTLKEWAKEADALLKVPQNVAKNASVFTRNPRILYHYRDQLGRHLNKLDKIPFPANSICLKLKRK
jgi:hypothetical protein